MNILKKLFDPKYRFFVRKIKSVTRQIWDLEFKVEKTLQIREGIRQDRDRMLDAQHKVNAAFKATPNDKKLEKDLTDITDTIKRYEAQMKMLDQQIEGGVATEENPSGSGINELIGSLAELRRMYKDYLKKI